MTSTNSNTKLAMYMGAAFLVLVAIFAAIYFLPGLFSGSGNADSENDPEPVSDNPYYLELRDSIMAYGQQNWNKTGYYTILNDIDLYLDPDPEPQITEEEAEDLRKLGTLKYFLTIGKAINDFCSNDDSEYTSKQLREGLEPFEEKDDSRTKPLKKLLDSYDSARALIYRIIKYGNESKFDQALSERYKRRLKRLEQDKLLTQRASIRNGIFNSRQKIDIPMGFHTIFESLTDEEIAEENCSDYDVNKYYFSYCDSIKTMVSLQPELSEPQDSIPATMPDTTGSFKY